MGGRKWGEEESKILADIAKEGRTLITQMHRLPGRSYDAAKVHASRHGIALSESSTWSPDERAILRRIYGSNESIKVGVRRLLPHRGYLAAKGEAQRLGLSGTKARRGRDGYSWVEGAITAILEDGGRMTVKQLAAATGAAPNSADWALNRKRGKKFRVGDWTRTSIHGDWAALWELGYGEDAPRPPRKTSSQSAREWRDRQRLCGGQANPFATAMRQVAA
ncbi:hypothetical protein [Paraburkholderia xenovorans]|uniref:hypothetical protein n=1 Tax=Paraburkholderia xenovorans TaxID=36873 RepID=UPI0015C54783|nr:hypothetical protein [Paraburkholderia xenovorans]NPT38563.1 hypothetical protein [Paraburkholderia xenovorans]